MAEATILKVQKRTGTGSRACAELRAQGRLPGVVYGKGEENVNVELAERDLARIIEYRDRMLVLDLDGSQQQVLLKDVQHGTYDHELLHADFECITADTIVNVEVEIALSGTAEGTKVGGVVEQELYVMHVSCRADDIPSSIELEIDNLNVGDILHVSDVPSLPKVP